MLKRWIETLNTTPVACEELTEERIWLNPEVQIWRAARFVGSPTFYPVYRWGEHYSYSPLSLVVLKGPLCLNSNVAQRVAEPGWIYSSGADSLDREIHRVGGPMKSSFKIHTPEAYARAITDAVKNDVARAEAAHPDFTNVILCGGKDSLNLLLLPWKNPVMVASAAPNFQLVKQFVADQALPFDVVELTDDDTLLPQEILLNFCRNNLEHCRWGPALVRIAVNLNNRVIFWKGQLGGTLTTKHWRSYTHPRGNDWVGLTRLCSLWGGRGEYRLRSLLERTGVTQRRTFRALWDRGAMWQGAHMSLLRQLTGALVLSGYHGPAMRGTVGQVNLNTAVPRDVRPLIGELLYGAPVRYPADNPGPPPSAIRRGVSHLEPFLSTLRSAGIVVRGE